MITALPSPGDGQELAAGRLLLLLVDQALRGPDALRRLLDGAAVRRGALLLLLVALHVVAGRERCLQRGQRGGRDCCRLGPLGARPAAGPPTPVPAGTCSRRGSSARSARVRLVLVLLHGGRGERQGRRRGGRRRVPLRGRLRGRRRAGEAQVGRVVVVRGVLRGRGLLLAAAAHAQLAHQQLGLAGLLHGGDPVRVHVQGLHGLAQEAGLLLGLHVQGGLAGRGRVTVAGLGLALLLDLQQRAHGPPAPSLTAAVVAATARLLHVADVRGGRRQDGVRVGESRKGRVSQSGAATVRFGAARTRGSRSPEPLREEAEVVPG